MTMYCSSLCSLLVSVEVGVSDEKTHAAAKCILLKMGEFFQIQVS